MECFVLRGSDVLLATFWPTCVFCFGGRTSGAKESLLSRAGDLKKQVFFIGVHGVRLFSLSSEGQAMTRIQEA